MAPTQLTHRLKVSQAVNNFTDNSPFDYFRYRSPFLYKTIESSGLIEAQDFIRYVQYFPGRTGVSFCPFLP